MESGWYMASTENIPEKYNKTIGFILNIYKWGIGKRRLNQNVLWCLDNGVFTGKFNVDAWINYIEKLNEYKKTCLFIVIPDVIGDCSATLEQFSHYRNMIKDYPVALVSQDGIKEHANYIPWDDFDCLFIGGSDEHKLGKEGSWILNQAKKRNKWIHVGRVNSVKRILQFWQADSWDGTCLSFGPYTHIKKFNAAVLQVRSMKKTKGLFDDLHFDVSHSDYFSKPV